VKRRFLFLQGMASPLFDRLGDWLIARGEEVRRINFCGGDEAYWRGKPATAYRRHVDELAPFLEKYYAEEGITDIVLFCDAFPVHRVATALAVRARIRIHVFEEGYVRPNWITLQRGPTHAAYIMPRDPQWYLDVNAHLSEAGEGRALQASIWARAVHDMAYHLAGLANPLAYPAYRTHRPFVAPVEYAGWARRYTLLPWWKVRDPRRIGRLDNFFFFPLQLNADVQVVRNSPFGTMEKAIEHVLTSFAQHAPRDTRLVIKNHPFDTGLSSFGSHIAKVAHALDVHQRVVYLETGGLQPIFDRALGVITVNSTVGFTAVQQGLATKVMGRAVYDIARITHQGPLDGFWTAPQRPEAEVCRAFRNVLIHATQINGGLYNARGIAMTLEGCDARLFEPTSRLEQLLERFPHPGVAEARFRGPDVRGAPDAMPLPATG
jgi:capsular polysaccharide export protein